MAGKFKKGPQASELFDVQDIADEKGVPGWETAGLMKAAGWVAGKQISEKEFETALDNFRNRRQGGGRT